jgi:hypothetical protein
MSPNPYRSYCPNCENVQRDNEVLHANINNLEHVRENMTSKMKKMKSVSTASRALQATILSIIIGGAIVGGFGVYGLVVKPESVKQCQDKAVIIDKTNTYTICSPGSSISTEKIGEYTIAVKCVCPVTYEQPRAL